MNRGLTTYRAVLAGLYAAGAVAVVPVLLGLEFSAYLFLWIWLIHFVYEWRRGALVQGRAATVLAYLLSVAIFFVGPGTLFDRIYVFLLWLLTVRYLTPKGVRDAFQILILAVAVLAAGGVLYPDPVFGVVFVGFLALSILTASLTYVYAELGDVPLRGRDIRALLSSLLPYELATLFLSVFFFVFLPRSALPLFAPVLRTSGQAVGITDTLDFGSLLPLLEDPTPVVRVVPLSQQHPPRLYLRLVEYAQTDGRTWLPLRSLPRPPRLFPGGKTERYEVVVEPLKIPYLPVVNGTFRMEGGPPRGRFYFQENGTVWLEPPARGLRHRFVVTRRTAAYADPPRRIHLRLPRDVPPLLLDSLNAWAGGETDPRRLADRIQKKFWQFTYTLTPPRGGGHPLEVFLKERAGYCEYFATAMALMLRAAGIPARVIGGLAGGVWNAEGNYWVLRQQDAHTWVEAWIPGAGWVTFDPTPPARFTGEAVELSGFAAWWDYVRLLWSRRVVQYSREDQMRLVFSGLEGVKVWTRRGGLALLVLGGMLILLLIRTGERRDPVVAEMEALLKMLARRGYAREPHEGLRDLARRVNHPAFTDLVEAYYAYRFGRHPSRGLVPRIRKVREVLGKTDHKVKGSLDPDGTGKSQCGEI